VLRCVVSVSITDDQSSVDRLHTRRHTSFYTDTHNDTPTSLVSHTRTNTLVRTMILLATNITNVTVYIVHPTQARASISQDYWGDINEDWRSGGRKPPSRVQGQSPGRGSGGEAEAFFVKLHIIFALKYNKQQLLLLLNDITSKILGGTCPPYLIGIDVPGHEHD